MLVRDLESIIGYDADIQISVYAEGFDIDWKIGITFEQALYAYGNYEIMRIFNFVSPEEKAVISIRVKQPRGECEMIKLNIPSGYKSGFRCESCLHENHEYEKPNFCPTCGAKVVK